MPPADRRAFVAERRAASAHRFDTVHSPRYDENWGAVSPSHAAFVVRLAGLVRQGGGYRYYPPRPLVRGWLEAAGFTVTEQADADSSGTSCSN